MVRRYARQPAAPWDLRDRGTPGARTAPLRVALRGRSHLGAVPSAAAASRETPGR